MSKEFFKETRFKPKSLELIAQCNRIITDYLGQGLKLTLRQLYYQCVVANIITNEEKSYKNLGGLISDARLAGLMDWDAIEDRGRLPKEPPEWNNLEDLVDAALRAYRLPRWKGQENYVELWVEKEALAGVLEPLAREFHVTLMVNKGYSSSSALYASAKRFIAARRDGADVADDEDDRALGGMKELKLFYLGDHDPSGEDMVRDIGDRLALFGVEDLEVRKLALTMTQITKYNPPPNPAKLSDSRAAAYVEKFGDSSWEVDALPPNVLAQIIRKAFKEVVDKDLMDEVKEKESRDKARLTSAVREIMEGEDG